MIPETTKKLRDVFAYGLLGVAGLIFISGLSVLFKNSNDLLGVGFSTRAAIVGHVFEHPILVISLVAAVALAIGLGEPSKNARVIVLAALGIGALSLLFGLICWFSGFGADPTAQGNIPSGSFDLFVGYAGVSGAGKTVFVLLGLAELLFLGVATWYALTAFQSLPKTARATTTNQWGQQQGYPAPGGYGQQGSGQPGGYGQPAGYPAPGGYGQPVDYRQSGGSGSTAQGAWGQQEAGGWAQQGQGQDQPIGQQSTGGWVQAAGPVGGAWTGTAGSWGDQSQAQAEQQGQAAAAWDQSTQPPQSSWGQPEPEPPQSSWGQPPQSSWGQPEGQPQSWGPPEGQGQQSSWGQPEEQGQQSSWGQPEEQGQQSSWGQPEGGAQQSSWGQPDEQAQQQSWGQPADESFQTPAQWGQLDRPDAEDSAGGSSGDESSATTAQQPADDEGDGNDTPPERGSWWHPGSKS